MTYINMAFIELNFHITTNGQLKNMVTYKFTELQQEQINWANQNQLTSNRCVSQSCAKVYVTKFQQGISSKYLGLYKQKLQDKASTFHKLSTGVSLTTISLIIDSSIYHDRCLTLDLSCKVYALMVILVRCS